MQFSTRKLATSAGLLALLSQPCALDAAAGGFSIRDHGAVGDGVALDTAAIQRAVDAAGAAGGGQVLFPAGRYLSGTIHLRSHVTLQFDAGARLIGTTNLTTYQQPQVPTSLPESKWGKWHRALLLGENLQGVTITGPGTIDGNRVFDPTGEEKMRGPHTVVLVNSRNVTVRDVTFVDSANYAILFFLTDDVDIHNVTFIGGWDGIHWRGAPDRWCRNVRITGCRFFTGDDAIAGRYWENTLISDCLINSSCNGIRLIGPARGLTIANNLFRGPGERPHLTSRERQRTNMLSGIILQPGAWDKTEGPLDEVLLANNTMQNVASAVTLWTKPGNPVGRVTVQGLNATGVYRAALSVESWADEPIREVIFRDVTVEFDGGGTAADARREVKGPGVDARPLPGWGVYARNVAALTLEDVRLALAKDDLRPVVFADSVGTLRLENFRFPAVADVAESIVTTNVLKLVRQTPEGNFLQTATRRFARFADEIMRTKNDILRQLVDPGVIAVVRARKASQAMPIAEALLAGGVIAVEITMTTPDAIAAIRELSAKLGDRALIGVGTVLDATTCRTAIAAGAQFVVSPICRPELAHIANAAQRAVMLGAYTPTEAQLAHEVGADFVKIFPADGLGPNYIKALRAPLPHLKIVPTGGVDLTTIGDFFKAGCAAVGAGSSLISKEILEKDDWAELTRRATEFVKAARAARSGLKT